jgi:hypothetical protein
MSPRDGDGAGDAAELIAGAPTVIIAPPEPVDDGGDTGERRPSQRDLLVSVADRAAYWRDEDGIAHVTIPIGEHVEHHRVRSRAFRDWLVTEADRPLSDPRLVGRARQRQVGRGADHAPAGRSLRRRPGGTAPRGP